MTINEMLTKIESYQEKLNLADDYLFNIVELDPEEIKAYRDKTAPKSMYEGTLTQIQRLYLLSLSPTELLERISEIQKQAELSDEQVIAASGLDQDFLADFKNGRLPTMNYVTALNALQSQYSE